MKKRLITIIFSLLLCCSIVVNTTCTVYAAELSLATTIYEFFKDAVQTFDNLDGDGRLKAIYSVISAQCGIVPHLSHADAQKISNAWYKAVTGNDFPTLEEDKKQAIKDLSYKLGEEGTKKDSNNNLVISSTTKTELRNCFNTYIQENIDVLYYTVHVASIEQIYPSNVGTTYRYNQLKQAVEAFDTVAFRFDNYGMAFYDLGSIWDDSFLLLHSLYRVNPKYYLDADFYSINKESLIYPYMYRVDFDDDKSIITDIKNNASSSGYNSSRFDIDRIDSSQAYNSTQLFSTSGIYVVSSEDKYVKVYTSLANYQNSLANKIERKYFYTSNYYVNNYADSSITSEQFVTLLDKIDTIVSTVAKEERENNYDEDALTRRLDALINAIWSSTGDISDDTGTLVDQNNKALKWYEKIYNKLCDIKGSLADDSISEPWNKEVTNLVKNTDNDTAMNNFFTSLSLTFSPVGESMKTKFPFSMPWDVYAVIVLLCAEPQTPKYTLPFKFDTFGIDTELVVDCSHLSFLATVSRTMLTLLYILGLIRLTTKIIGKGDD